MSLLIFFYSFHDLIRLTAASRKAESPQNHRPTHPFVHQNYPFIIPYKLKNTQDFDKDIGCQFHFILNAIQ